MVLDDIHGAHGKASAIDQAANVAIHAYEAETTTSSLELGWIFFRGVTERFDIWMAEKSVVVENNFGVERHDNT